MNKLKFHQEDGVFSEHRNESRVERAILVHRKESCGEENRFARVGPEWLSVAAESGFGTKKRELQTVQKAQSMEHGKQ